MSLNMFWFYPRTVTAIIWEQKKVHARSIMVICNKSRKLPTARDLPGY